jgi:hypothetical protein
VIAAIKIVLVQPVGDLIPGGVVQHQTAQHRLFGFERMRRNPQRFGGGILTVEETE